MQLISRLELIAHSERFIVILLYYFLVAQMDYHFQIYAGLSVYVYGGLHKKCLHCQQLFC